MASNSMREAVDRPGTPPTARVRRILASSRETLLLSRVTLATLGAGLGGCGGGDLLLPGDSRPAAISVMGGNNQTAPIGRSLADPLVVRVTDPRSRPVAQLRVTFVVTAGGGRVVPDTAVTDNDGLATVRWTLGTTPGTQTVDARVFGSDTLSATLNGTASASPDTTKKRPPADTAKRIPPTPPRIPSGTATTLSSHPNPSRERKRVTFTAEVTSAFGSVRGAIRLVEGSCDQPTSAWGTRDLDDVGRAELSTKDLSPGTHLMVACYLGNSTFAPSASAVLFQRVKSNDD